VVATRGWGEQAGRREGWTTAGCWVLSYRQIRARISHVLLYSRVTTDSKNVLHIAKARRKKFETVFHKEYMMFEVIDMFNWFKRYLLYTCIKAYYPINMKNFYFLGS
jgi:hypothetical protein